MKAFPHISPFKLLQPYDKGDVRIYFGREDETRQLTEALMLSKFMLLYGASGTGKTSLIQCGLQGMFSPRDWLPIFVRRGNNFIESLREGILKVYRSRYRLRYPGQEPDLPSDISLREAVKALFKIAYVPVYLILDQFEEIFTIGTRQEQQAFFDALGDLRLFEEDLFCKLIIVTREEYIAHFYQYEKALPYLFEYRFRVEKMRQEQLLKVVEGTLNYSYENYPTIQLESGVAEQILDNLTDKRGETDLTDLQVYLDRLYREDLERKPPERDHILFDASLAGDHKLDNVLSDFLDQQVVMVSQRMTPSDAWGENIKDGILQVLFKLVTGQGTKQHRSVTEIYNDLHIGKLTVSQAQLEECLNLLSAPDVHLLNQFSYPNSSEKRFEIWHDRLAQQLYKKFSVDELKQREALITLRNKKKRFETLHKKGQEHLSKGEITLVTQSLNLNRLNPEESSFLEASRRYRKKQGYLRHIVIAVIGLLGFTALWFGIDSLQKARVSSIVANSRLMAEKDATKGISMLQKAKAMAPNDPVVLEAGYKIYSENEFYLQSFEHPYPVIGVAMAPDSNGVIYSWTHEMIYRWDRDGILRDTFQLPSLSAAALSPNGKWLMVSTWEGDLIKLEAATLLPKQQVIINKGKNISVIAFNPNGKSLFVVDRDNVIELSIDELSKQLNHFDIINPPVSLAFNSRTNALVLGHKNGAIEVITSDTLMKKSWVRHKDQVLSFAINPGGNTIVSGGRDALLNFWDKQGNLQLTLKGHDRRINDVTWTPDGQRLLSAGTDHLVKSWSSNGDLISTYRGHSSFVNALSISKDGQYFASASEDKKVLLWKVASKITQRFGPHPNGVAGALISRDGKMVITASDAGRNDLGEEMNDPNLSSEDFFNRLFQSPARSAFLWDTYTGKKLAELKGHQGGINAVSSSLDGNYFATASDDGFVFIWDRSGELIDTLMGGHNGKIVDVDFSTDGQLLLTAGDDSTAILWSRKGIKIKELKHPAIVRSVAFSPNGNLMATGCYDGIARLFDLEGHELQLLKQGDSLRIEAIAFSPDSKNLFVGKWGNRGQMYDLKGNLIFEDTLLSENKTGGAAIRSVAFSADGRYVCMGAEGGLAQIYSIIDNNSFPLLALHHYPPRAVLSVQFSSDGKYILTGTNDGWARLWDLDY